ncbi:cytochrome P450 [Gautieria morchelliformis]|nr:cytochrome P450 [Gautieria morchelliformis]
MASSPLSDFDSSVLAGACAAGFLTWIILKHRSVRGDFAALFYSVASATLFLHTHQYNRTVKSPLVFCLALAGIYAFSALLCTIAYRLSPFHPLARYPGPRLWWISSLRLAYVSFHGRRHFILHALHAKYGPFVRIGPNALSINSPLAQVLHSRNMEKSDAYVAPGHLNTVSLFFKQKTKEIHSNRKRIWSLAFTNSGLANFFNPLERRTWQLLKCIETRQGEKGVVELSKCFCHWSYDFMGEMVFGGSNNLELMRDGDPHDLVEGGKLAMMIVDSAGQAPWLMDILWHLPAGKGLHRMQHVATEMMRTRIKADKNVEMRDLASYLIEGNTQTGEKIPLPDLEVEAVVAITAGSDTTSVVLSITTYFLLADPSNYQKLQAELDHAIPDRTGYLDPNTLINLPFLNAVVNESLRLGTPFFLPRVIPEGGVSIDGNFIPEGTMAAFAAYSQQTSPENFYPDPLAFIPERWYPGGLGPGSITEKSVLNPFSSGPYVCAAKNFAYHQIRHVIARLVLAFDMTLPPGFDVQGFRDNLLNTRTSILGRPLMVNVTRRPGLDLESFM